MERPVPLGTILLSLFDRMNHALGTFRSVR
jgi:hypothetical protein